jgi:site-specific recombinase XerD
MRKTKTSFNEKASQYDYAKFGQSISVHNAIQRYLETVTLARSEKTAQTYRYAMKAYSQVLAVRGIEPEKMNAASLPEDTISWFATYLKDYTSATESLYLQAVKNFFEFMSAENLASPNLPRIRLLIRQRSRRPGQRLPQFPADQIEKVIEYAIKISELAVNSDNDRLINLRDRAFLVTLADTGLRVHEACNLRRGDIDWNEGRALIIGKGDRQAVVRFSNRSMKVLKDYLNARAALDGASGRPLPSLPLFARHDKGAGKKIKRITTVTGRNIVAQRVKEALGEEAAGRITPHSFRHYFVTTVLRSSGNLKLAQELARHRNIAVTQRYAHLSDDELDKGYWEVFEE